MALSSALLPTFKVFMVLLVLAAALSTLLRRSFIKVYSKAQVALQETLAHPPVEKHESAPVPLPSMLKDANLETVALPPNSPAIGKLIRELQLRTRTGASIVGIERTGRSVINPGADEEIEAGDQLLLLGTRAQLDAGEKELLTLH